MSELNLREDADGVLIPLRVKPRSGQDTVSGVQNGALLVSVRAAPADGEANAAVIAIVARQLDCARSLIEVVRGHRGRDKMVRARGLTAEIVRQRLNL